MLRLKAQVAACKSISGPAVPPRRLLLGRWAEGAAEQPPRTAE